MTYQPWTSFASLQLHAQKWDTNTVPTDYLQVYLSRPVLCGYLNFQRTIDFIYFKISKEPYALVPWKKTESKSHRFWLVICFFQKNCEPWLCKNWVFDVLRTMIMIVIIIKGLFLFLLTTQHQSLPGVGYIFFDPSNW
jgi:hypothetical protein